MERKFSIIIPTLLKRPDILSNLLSNLYEDDAVSEILLINNSEEYAQELLPVSNKLKVLETTSNIYVNPSWNLGVKASSQEFIGILNDDITVPEKIFSIIAQIPIETCGVLGMSHPHIFQTESPDRYAVQNIQIAQTDTRTWGYGIFMVMHKKNYIESPREMLIWCHDDFLFHMNRVNGKKNGVFLFPIKTKMSTTSDLPEFDEIKKNDIVIYEKLKKQYNL